LSSVPNLKNFDRLPDQAVHNQVIAMYDELAGVYVLAGRAHKWETAEGFDLVEDFVDEGLSSVRIISSNEIGNMIEIRERRTKPLNLVHSPIFSSLPRPVSLKRTSRHQLL